jgi:predicted MFS family arabinose efflux permease
MRESVSVDILTSFFLYIMNEFRNVERIYIFLNHKNGRNCRFTCQGEAVSADTSSVQRPLLLRNRQFALVWLGQVLSQSGSKAYLINLLWWIMMQAANDAEAARWSGMLLVLSALPGIVLVLPIGHLLNRWPVKRLLVGGEACAALLVLAILLLLHWHSLSMPLLIALSVAIAACQALVDPALTRAVTMLVPPEDVEGAVGLEASTQSLAYFIGTGVGATLCGLFGLEAALLLNILSYVISASASSMARFAPQTPGADAGTDAGTDAAAGAGAAGRGAFAALGVMPLLYSFAMANFFMFPLFLVLPMFTRNVLHGSITQLGMLEACFWLGLIAGAMASNRLWPHWPVQKITGGLFALFGGLLIGVWLWPNPFWTGVVLFLGGSSAGLINVKVITWFQRVVPDADKGLFFAKLQGFVTSSQPLGYFAFTLFLAQLSAHLAFALQGAGLLLIGLFCLQMKDNKPDKDSA